MAAPRDPLSGQQGLYYYYHTMAKALSIYGESIITDEKGARHDWARELAARLVRLQKPQGCWVNEADRWMEGIPELDTSYALVALTICKEGIEKQGAKKAGK
jgi:squalene-hopene/tetraprenyl-beta-curcumene cyclase